MDTGYRRGGLVGPVVLIGLGILLLLDNLGLLSSAIWEILLRMWPVLLIAIGIDLLIARRSVWGRLLALVLIVAVFAGGFWLSGARLLPGRGTVASEEVRQPLQGATEADVTIAQAWGDLRVHSTANSGLLAQGTVPSVQGETTTRRFDLSGKRAIFELRSSGTSSFPFVVGNVSRVWDIGLGQETPINLRADLGAGDSTIDLENMLITGLRVNMGVGHTTVTLPSKGRFEGTVNTAIGETVIVVPKGMAVRVRIKSGLSSVKVPDGYQQLGVGDHTYTSPGYETAQDRVDLTVSQAIGSVVIR